MNRTPHSSEEEGMDLAGTIPDKGLPRAEIIERLAAMKAGDADWEGGRTFSLVYHGGDEHLQLIREAYNLYIAENLLNPMAFQSLRNMEKAVVRMTAAMLHGDGRTVGTMTSGGTESILLAVKTCRDRARRLRPWVRRPELLAPASIHVAFEKACRYFDVKLVRVPLADDFRVDMQALKHRLSRRTVMIAASAPQFPHGVIDPIADLGELAESHGIPFHVDACIGGFFLPWLEDLGQVLPPWDLRVPGVTSISADVHKFGYASKGASVLLHRDMEHMRHQFFISTDWCGGIYAGATMQGTRAGGAVAAAYAAMTFMGRDGYRAMARGAMEAASRYREAVSRIDGIRVLGEPVMSLVAIASDSPAVDIFAVADLLEDRGWLPDRQQNPDSLHVTLTGNHLQVIDRFVLDLADAVATVRADPGRRSRGKAAMYGMMAKAPIRGLVRVGVQKIMENMYSPEGRMPDLGELGAGSEDPVLRFIGQHGARAIQWLDRVRGLARRPRR